MITKYAIVNQDDDFLSMKVCLNDDLSGTIIFSFTTCDAYLWDSRDGAEDLLEAEQANLIEQWGEMDLRIVEVSFR